MLILTTGHSFNHVSEGEEFSFKQNVSGVVDGIGDYSSFLLRHPRTVSSWALVETPGEHEGLISFNQGRLLHKFDKLADATQYLGNLLPKKLIPWQNAKLGHGGNIAVGDFSVVDAIESMNVTANIGDFSSVGVGANSVVVTGEECLVSASEHCTVVSKGNGSRIKVETGSKIFVADDSSIRVNGDLCKVESGNDCAFLVGIVDENLRIHRNAVACHVQSGVETSLTGNADESVFEFGICSNIYSFQGSDNSFVIGSNSEARFTGLRNSIHAGEGSIVEMPSDTIFSGGKRATFVVPEWKTAVQVGQDFEGTMIEPGVSYRFHIDGSLVEA